MRRQFLESRRSRYLHVVVIVVVVGRHRNAIRYRSRNPPPARLESYVSFGEHFLIIELRKNRRAGRPKRTKLVSINLAAQNWIFHGFLRNSCARKPLITVYGSRFGERRFTRRSHDPIFANREMSGRIDTNITRVRERKGTR